MRNDSRATIRGTGVGQIDLPTLPRIARLIEWRPWNGSTSLIGHCSVAFNGGWVVHRIPVFPTKDGSLAAGAPSAALIGTDGKVKIKPDGGRAYEAIIAFADAQARERWSSAVLTALADSGISGEGAA
jgi:hypothetical protein